MPFGLLPQRQLLRTKSSWCNKTSNSARRCELSSRLLPIQQLLRTDAMMTEFSPATEDIVDAFVCGGDTTHERLAAALRALGSRIYGAPEIREAIFDIAFELHPIPGE